MVAAVLTSAPTAAAHPLGNFSVNHVSTVRISEDQVQVGYVLDQAEIPTVQERGLSPAELLRRKRDVVLRGLDLTVDGRRAPLAVEGRGRVSFPPGSAGLRTSRFELELSAAVESPRAVRLHDGTFPGRVGWRAIVAAPGERTAVRTRTPSGDATQGLRRYPDELLSSPADRRDAEFRVEPGDGTLVAPRGEPGDGTLVAPRGEPGDGTLVAPRGEPGELTRMRGRATSSDGFAGLFERAAAGQGVLVLLLVAALGWGALHALSPGHGKAMVAAYLVGSRGTARHAVALGATVTITHTIGVFALGLVTLGLSQYVLPEDLYPWLTLVSGLLVVSIGAAVLRSRLRSAKHRRGHSHSHRHHPHHDRHAPGWVGLLGMGAAAGLIPCPSALVVLLGAVSQHELALGMLLIVAFSLGLAGTLTALGLAAVHARRLLPRLSTAGHGGAARVAAVLPAASAVVIVGVGCLLTANAVPNLM